MLSWADRGYVDVVRALLEGRAHPSKGDQWGMTPLHRAAWHNNVDVTKALLEYKARKDRKERHGKTPLDVAVEKGHDDVAKLLSAD